MKNIFKNFLIICLSFFLIISCNEKSNPGGPTVNNADISGIWIAEEVINGDCPDGDYPEYQTELFSVEQNGNNVTFTIIGETDSIMATIFGNKIAWLQTETDSTEVFINNFTGTVSGDGKTINGTATWIWSDNSTGNSCSGTTSVTARKAQTPAYNAEGKWQGIWLSDSGHLQGTFEVSITQDNSMLTGTIDIPGVFFSLKNLKGVLSGTEIIFGDIDDEILFSGTMNSTADSTLGDYVSEYLDDNGAWQGWKTSDSLDKQIIVLDSIALNSNCNGDITFDGTNLWAVNDDYSQPKIYKLSNSGAVLDSFNCPGDMIGGLTFDGTDL